MHHINWIWLVPLLSWGWHCPLANEAAKTEKRPNILLVIADDWSHPHASAYGDSAVKTPHFDRVAREGILFDHAYVSSPSCTPSRAALLTGQHFWRLAEGANLYGPLRPEIPVYTDLLAEAGYHVGYTGKGWGPGHLAAGEQNPAGRRYDSLEDFLTDGTGDQPFCFWFGSGHPHRGYEAGAGVAHEIDLEKIDLPACFPDDAIVRSDMADYYKEVQDFDDQLGGLLAELERRGDLENTLVFVTSDNGMPFPRCKSNIYDMGTRVPLAIRWGDQLAGLGRTASMVSLTDLAPTFLEVAGVPVPEEMTGQSLWPLLQGSEEASSRDRVFVGKERHVPGQESGDWRGYPMRGVRTHDYLYIQNFLPALWPAGTPDFAKATFYPAYYADVDAGPTRTYMVEHQDVRGPAARLFDLAFGRRPGEELYDLARDPDQLVNLADEPRLGPIKDTLRRSLADELQRTGDPRSVGGQEVFSDYPYMGGTPLPDAFVRRGPGYATVKLDHFASAHIGPRKVEVLVPINVSHAERFAVIYMFDGQNLFDPFRRRDGQMSPGWRVQQVLDSLHRAGTIDPMIVVAIHHGRRNRGKEYMPAQPAVMIKERAASSPVEVYRAFATDPPRSDDHLSFLVHELKPHIDAHFKTMPEARHTFVAGASMGGLLAAYAICEYPEIFGGAACLSTHWPVLDGVFLEYLKDHLPDPATHRIYFDHGTQGLDRTYPPYQQRVDQLMRARGYNQGSQWMTRQFEGADHRSEDWHKRLHVPLEFLMARGD